MNPVMLEYFRRKLLRWQSELLQESTETLNSLQVGGGIFIREKKLHTFETILGCSREAVKKGVFVVHHGEVGGKTWHCKLQKSNL